MRFNTEYHQEKIMFPFFAPQALTDSSLIAATKIMLKVAATDGVHPAEIALIEGFYNSGAIADGTSFASVAQAAADVSLTPASFSNDQEREMVVALSVMTGFADGAYSEKEHAVVRDIAVNLGVTSSRLDEIIETIKDHMLAQLSHLPDAVSVAVVAKELG
jgi:uncharacterized tellurite resistance protein B-like protein